MREGRARSIVAVLIAALSWASLGTSYALFKRWFDIDEVTIVTLRGSVATVLLYVYLRMRGTRIQRTSMPDTLRIVALGLTAVTAFYLVLIYAFSATSVPVATLILYLAPTIVAIGGFMFLGERLSGRHILALALSFLGCALVARVYAPGALRTNGWGLLLCLGSALAYASYSLQVKPLLRRVAGETIILGHLLVGSIGLLIVKLVLAPTAWPSPIGIVTVGLFSGLVLTLIPLLAYTYGLRGLPAGEAATIATLEPVLATALAWGVLGDRLAWPQLLGGAFVIGSVVVLATAGVRWARPGAGRKVVQNANDRSIP